MDYSTQLDQDMRLLSRGLALMVLSFASRAPHLITVTRNDPDMKLYIPVVVCHNDGGNLQTSFLHCSLGHRRQVWTCAQGVGGEQLHRMDENKQEANSGRKRSILSIDIVNRIF